MNDIKELHRVRNKMFDIIYLISEIDRSCNKVYTQLTEEEINNLIEKIKEYQKSNELLQTYLFDYLNNLTNAQNDIELNTEETEEGYRI